MNYNPSSETTENPDRANIMQSSDPELEPTRESGSGDQQETASESISSATSKSSISVYFADWIPASSDSGLSDTSPDTKPLFGGSRPRYFHANKGQGKIRPGLGVAVEELEALRSRTKNKKRKKTKGSPEYENAPFSSKKLKITPEKPPCAVLHELYPNLEYNFDELKVEGSKSTPSFSCSVDFPSPQENGQEQLYIGTGRSKKLAKNNAAEKILTSLGYQVPILSEDEEMGQNPYLVSIPHAPPEFCGHHHQPHNKIFQGNLGVEMDFSSDEIINVNFASQNELPMLSQPMIDSAILHRLRNIPSFEENICLALNTILFPEIVDYEFVEEDGPPHNKVFTMKARFNNQEYVGQGGSKKKAKADAARKAVVIMLGENCFNAMVHSSSNIKKNMGPWDGPGGEKKKKKGSKKPNRMPLQVDAESEVEQEDEDDEDCGEYDLNFSDHISNVIREKYEELMGKDANHAPFKVLAGVVLTTGSPMIYKSTVIAVTTGTKCIEGDCMSEQGLSVNDSHAEILATRCVRDYLYSQIELFEASKSEETNSSILEENTSPNSEFKYQLKENVKFHLYISTSPCGDARIFSPKGIELDEDQPSPSPSDLEDSHPNKLNRGVLRSKIEAGEGTIPSANLYQGPQTWDSIVCGNALYTMSCSDKVCRWNVLGFQGALLHSLIGAVHYSSITLGSLHHPVHFTRAVFGRVEALDSRLEVPFRINKPKLMMVSREEKRRVKKSPNHAVCWSINWSTPEILIASKGRCEPGGVASRITKRVLFTRFLKLYKNETGRRENYVDLTYHEAKQEAAGYQKAKEEFVMYFKESKLGQWIGKPVEQDTFKILK